MSVHRLAKSHDALQTYLTDNREVCKACERYVQKRSDGRLHKHNRPGTRDECFQSSTEVDDGSNYLLMGTCKMCNAYRGLIWRTLPGRRVASLVMPPGHGCDVLDSYVFTEEEF